MRETARTWLDVGRLPLSRRDRAAMVLALECLRSSVYEACDRHGAAMFRLDSAFRVLQAGGTVARDMWRCAWPSSREIARLDRARLAITLRVLLRVDAGEDGAGCVTCWGFGSMSRSLFEKQLCKACGGSGSAPWRALWNRAPEHGIVRAMPQPDLRQRWCDFGAPLERGLE